MEYLKSKPERSGKVKRGIATAVSGTVIAASLAGCFGASRIPKDQPICETDGNKTATGQSWENPSATDLITCLLPEVLDTPPTQIIELTDTASVINTTDTHIDPAGIAGTYEFFHTLADRTDPIFRDQQGITFPVTIQDEAVPAYISNDPPAQQVFFIVDEGIEPEHLESEINRRFYHGADLTDKKAVTLGNIEIYPRTKIKASFIHTPAPGDTDYTLLKGIHIEMCQNNADANPKFTTIEEYEKNDLPIQESVCNTLGHALADVQQGISAAEIVTKYVDDRYRTYYVVSGVNVRTVPLHRSMIEAFNNIPAAV